MDAKQYRECNRQFKKQVESNAALRANFSEEQLAMIQKRRTPRGFVWHHEVEKGKIKLVNREIHKRTSHTGGRCLWGRASQK